ncbi:hypothetical protein B0H17DRAFT_1271834 [Mycena rosella]|uniref:Uncharacterized protein n=1 Tax=Mycena rosella TaxID=1033263 RepID=A0AAD7DN85_MYCRO|nr:hypothetical protein B0H17DRAFT_1271834 [Mycena rosella]
MDPRSVQKGCPVSGEVMGLTSADIDPLPTPHPSHPPTSGRLESGLNQRIRNDLRVPIHPSVLCLPSPSLQILLLRNHHSTTSGYEWKTVGQTDNTAKDTPKINKTTVWIRRDGDKLQTDDGKDEGTLIYSLKTDSLEFIDAWCKRCKIEVSDFNPAGDSPMDFSTLTSLVLLRITAVEKYNWQVALGTLSTIAHPNRIRKIVISSTEYLPAECGLQFDYKLDSLPLHPLLTIELERNIFEGGLTISKANQDFPQMTSRQLRHITDHEENWFEACKCPKVGVSYSPLAVT